MADVLVSGIKISDMDLVNNVTGVEKVPTDQAGDRAVNIDQILAYVNSKIKPVWGSIQGDIDKQTDLTNLINTKFVFLDDKIDSNFNNLQNQINVIGTGNKAYKTYAEMDADKANIPANSKVTVTNDPNANNNGDWQWNGTVFTKSIYDPYSLAKAYADSNKIFKPVIINTGIDFDNYYSEYALYTIVSGTAWNASTHKPNFTNQWAQLYVLPVSSTVSAQFVICLNTFAMALRFRNTDGIWTPWHYFSDDTVLTANVLAQVKSNIKTYVNPVYASLSKNLLDPNNLLTGYEIHATNGVIPEANSVTTSYISVRGMAAISVSGLQNNPQIGRLYRFLDKNEQVIQVTGMGLVNSKTITVPAGAEWFQISVKQRNPDPLNIALAQIEAGNAITAFTSFVRGDIIGILGAHIQQTPLNLGYDALGKNLLNPNTLLKGIEVYGDGSLLPQAQSVTTNLINVQGVQNITLSGLQPNPEIPRYYRFLDENQVLISRAQVPNPNTVYTITIPSNAKYFQVSLLQRTATVLDISNTQIEKGANATAHEDYVAGVSSINGVDLISSGGGGTDPQTPISRAIGAKYLIFGDSITQTSDVDNGSVNSPTWFANWPTYAKDQLKMSDFKNYAKSGAAFREYGQTNPWQMISHQVNTAIANNESPDVIVIACGTNDAGINLGDFDTAMGKATLTDLNRALTLESMRWALWTLRQKWPNAVCFFCSPMQRADAETPERKSLNENLPRMARQYGFNVIDQYGKTGVIKDLEIWQANGTFLIDGLHTNVAGKQLQANYIVSEIINRMMY